MDRSRDTGYLHGSAQEDLMVLRKLGRLMAVAALALLAIGASSALATTALRVDPGGGLKGAGSAITNTSAAPSVWTVTGWGTITCNQTNINASVSSSSSATTISGTLNTLTLTTCSDTIPVITYTSCTLSPHSPLPTITINSAGGTGGTTTINDPTLRCNIAGSATSFCYYTAASAAGTGNNAASTLTYTNVTLAGVAGSGSLGTGVCGAAGSFSTTLRHIVETGTNRTVTVTTS
jgi:hypothetical protein